MDTYVEQLVAVKQTGKAVTVKISLWVIAALVFVGMTVASVLYSKLAFIFLLIAAGAFFGAYYLGTQLNLEYEYLFTNGEIDIDRIINKNSRTRMATFECRDIENIEKYDGAKHRNDKRSGKNIYFGCTPDESSVAFTIRHPKKGSYTLVINPNDEFREAVRKSVAYILKNKI